MIPDVSVVTLSYNQADYLPAAIESVLSQQGATFEYFLCDPGSSDGSREIIAGFTDPRITSVFEADSGPPDGLNKCFARARGRIFCYINADDMLLAGAFARMVEFFQEQPAIDVACGHALVIDKRGIVVRRVWSEPFAPYAVATGAHVQIQPATFIRSEAYYRSGGFDVANNSNWDGGLLAELYTSGARIEVVDEFLGCYRLHPESITMSGRMAERHRTFAQENFKRLIGRSPTPLDSLAGAGLRVAKHLRHPARTWERLLKGPLFRAA